MKMIWRLQAEFVIVTMLVLILVLGIILGTVNIWVRRVSSAKTDQILLNMLEHDGSYNAVVNKDGSFLLFRTKKFDFNSVRNAFAIRYSNVDNSIKVITPHPLYFTNEEVREMIATIIKYKTPKGNYDGIRYSLKKTDCGFLGAFVDRRIDDNAENNMARISVFIFVVSLLFAMLLSFFMSYWAVTPVKTAFAKQKQFIGDASHELKTPLAVINTNLSVLEEEVGVTKWSVYIHNEIGRMSELVKDLLFLAKYEDVAKSYEFNPFNISKAITAVVLPFESLAFEKGQKLEYDIADDLVYHGDEKRIRQLAAIFVDNAIKHCDSKKTPLVRLCLCQIGSKIQLSVFNTGSGLNAKERKKIFERFYCTDSSRNRQTGGSGLGLAIASTIVQAHKSKINVESKVGKWVRFSVLL